ncbi:MAG: hypothetical protein RRZ24_01815 [Clostridia bacterium]
MKLYNVIFPIWLLWLIPATWVVVLPANFLIDLLVIVLALRSMQVTERKRTAKSIIWKVWLLGFAADFIGTVLMFMANVLDFGYETPVGKWWYENITNAVSMNPFENIYAIFWVTACVVVSGCCIYFFNRRIALAKSGLDDAQKKRLALLLAVCTAPYLFYLPTVWVY